MLYILSLKSIVQRHGILQHRAADNTQLYSQLSLNHAIALQKEAAAMEKCLADVHLWMIIN